MGQSLWLDLILLLALGAVLAVVYFLSAAHRSVVADGANEAARRSWFDRLWYYPRLSRQAGYDPAGLSWIYWASKLFFALLFPLILLQLWGVGSVPAWPIVLLVALVGFFVPDLWLSGRRKSRQQTIRASLSYFLDLLAALLHSGLNVEQAFRRAGREGFNASHPLAQEVDLIGREIEAGRDRIEAFDQLADRTGIPELRSTAAALRSGLTLGAPVAETLEVQADLIRDKRREDARKEINLAAVKSLVPLILCGFPLFAVVVFYPTVKELYDFFRELTSLWN